jgi:hypothetical protein
MKKEKPNLEKDQNMDPEKGSEKKQTTPAANCPENAGTDSIHNSVQPTLHRKPFEDKSRMPLSSEEYDDDDFEIDGE